MIAATIRRTSSRCCARSRSAQIASQALPWAVRIWAPPVTARSTVCTTPTATEMTARGSAVMSRAGDGRR
jgi:hypothetical protein